jgi:tetratricopeptide (TPR) repeat protein
MMKRWMSAVAVLALSSAAFPAMKMTTNVKEGQVLSGDFVFEVRVQSEALVSSVEFYVGDDLRNTDESTPYQFKIDTLEETEGTFKVTFAAYNSEGQSVKESFNLKIDNGLGKGVDFHVERADTFLAEGKFREAIQACRIALKIDKANNKARMAMARANYAAGNFDIAQKFVEDVLASDPNNLEAKALFGAVNLRRAFVAGGSDSVAVIKGALSTAAKTQQEVMEKRADAVGEPTDANMLNFLDANLRAHRYTRVTSLIRPIQESKLKDTEVMNRYLYALVRSGRFAEAGKLIQTLNRYGAPDGYTFALKSVILQMLGDQQNSVQAEKDTLLEAPTGSVTKSMQMYLALARGNFANLGNHSADLLRLDPAGSLSNYYGAVEAFINRDFDSTVRRYQTSLLADPANYDMLVERGHQIIESALTQRLQGETRNERLVLAQAYFEAALGARPESFEALTGMTIIFTMMEKTEEATSFGAAAVAASQEYGAAYYAYASAMRLRQFKTPGDQTLRAKVQEILAGAEKSDRRLRGVAPPSPEVAWNFFYRAGRIPALPLPPRS